MGDLLKEIAGLFVSALHSDVSPEDRKAARRVFVKVGWRVAIALALFWAYGLFDFLGLGGGFAKAEDIKAKIDAATQPLKQSLDQLTAQVLQSLAEAKAAEIRALTYKQCIAPSGEKAQFQTEIDRKQEEYLVIRKQYYQIRCDQVM